MKKDYKETLTQCIKDAGQELIDRAPEMVHSDAITDFNIHISFDQEFGSVPEISWTTSVVTKTTMERLTKEYIQREAKDDSTEND